MLILRLILIFYLCVCQTCCRTARDKLKKFLDDEILQKYSFLYKQKSDNAAPHGGSMEEWLQKMLAQMQASIEQHVNSAMDGSSL